MISISIIFKLFFSFLSWFFFDILLLKFAFKGLKSFSCFFYFLLRQKFFTNFLRMFLRITSEALKLGNDECKALGPVQTHSSFLTKILCRIGSQDLKEENRNDENFRVSSCSTF